MICAIIVTYNRKLYLEKCVKALLNGTTKPSRICIIDNASTDGTEDYIKSCFKEDFKQNIIHYKKLSENIGGAGGFHEGLKLALEFNCEYFWLMDDDAEPDENALTALVNSLSQYPKDKFCLVSISTDKEQKKLSWGTGIISGNKTVIYEDLKDIPFSKNLKAPWAPFLGFLIPRQIVMTVGLPRKDYFIWGDDVEYSSRIWRAGYEIYYVRESIIYHPIQKKIKLNILGRKIVLIDADDWKQYYGMRNDVYTLSRQKRYIDMIKRIIFFLLVWKARGMNFRTLHFYLKGLYHGIIGRLGKYQSND